MDTLFLFSHKSEKSKSLAHKFDELLQKVKSNKQPSLNIDKFPNFILWHDKYGESTIIDNPKIEIWFDGYLYTLDKLNLNQFLIILAERITRKGKVLRDDESGIFNIIVRDKKTGFLFLANDPSGLFPLYYAHVGKEFYASTHLYMLAKALDAKPDYVQVVSKEVFGYAIGPDTYFEGVKRLLPGEVIIFDPQNNSLESRYSEIYFQGYTEPKGDLLERVNSSLKNPIDRIVEDHPKVGMMLSEGFDSRLIAALFNQAGAEVYSYTHGTAGTKGVRVAETVATKLRLKHHFEEVTFPSNHDQIQRQLLLADNLHIPFWHRGSRYFGDLGLDAVVAGTALDSTLGGHIFYKSSNNRVKAIFQRYQEILRQNLGMISDVYIENLSEELIHAFLGINTDRLERRLRERFVPDIAEKLLSSIDPFRDCLQTEFARISRTGSDLPSLKLQRFFLEHRARRFSFGQELTLRMNNHVVVPSYERTFMKVVTRIPVRYKLNHGLYLRLLKRYFPKAASLPSGNFPLPANYPRLLLESSRFVAKVKDLKIINAFLTSEGRSEYSGYRGALFQDKNSRDQDLFNFFHSFHKSNNKLLNEKFYLDYLKRVEIYQARTYQFEDFYRAVEFSQIFQHSF